MNFGQNASQEVTIDDLPNEHIFSFLDHDDCLEASLFCHRWYCNAFQIRPVALDIRLDSPSFQSTVSKYCFNGKTYCTTTGFEAARKLLPACQFEVKLLHAADCRRPCFNYTSSRCIFESIKIKNSVCLIFGTMKDILRGKPK
ncbi:uncharacterized protein LOC119765627 [Culex quinquefasciatus]|uniref:uncharacterized protein LOC119765627 n=1 Tax=Culex quinquefasciatus TaxID=7176 RepID=UPI0018E2C36F|nr:uncharacterized protein LOC119765627 [Culex quinquefasciatus]